MNQWFRISGGNLVVRLLLLGLAYSQFVQTEFAVQVLVAQEWKHESPIVLRDLTLIRNKSVTDFDDEWIVLSDKSRLTWDQVLKAKVSDERQAEFDEKLERLGLPMFRLKSRIRNGDWIGAGEIAGPIFDSTIASDKTIVDIDAAYLVCLTTMKRRIRHGDRAGALVPFTYAALFQPKVSRQVLEIVDTNGIPERDLDTFFSSEILPVWFDESKLQPAVNLLTSIEEIVFSETGRPPAVGMSLYLASMKIEMGQTDGALDLLRETDVGTDTDLLGWQTVLQARVHQRTKEPQKAQTMLEMNAKKTTGTAQLAADYYRGINVIDQEDTSDLDRTKAILTLLRIPALHGDDFRDLAAAAIYQAAKIAELRGRGSDSEKLRDELLRQYPRTYHGQLETHQRSGR